MALLFGAAWSRTPGHVRRSHQLGGSFPATVMDGEADSVSKEERMAVRRRLFMFGRQEEESSHKHDLHKKVALHAADIEGEKFASADAGLGVKAQARESQEEGGEKGERQGRDSIRSGTCTSSAPTSKWRNLNLKSLKLSFMPPLGLLGAQRVQPGLTSGDAASSCSDSSPAPASSLRWGTRRRQQPNGEQPPRVLVYDRTVVVRAEAASVLAVLSDFGHYQEWGGGNVLKQVRVLSARDAHKRRPEAEEAEEEQLVAYKAGALGVRLNFVLGACLCIYRCARGPCRPRAARCLKPRRHQPKLNSNHAPA